MCVTPPRVQCQGLRPACKGFRPEPRRCACHGPRSLGAPGGWHSAVRVKSRKYQQRHDSTSWLTARHRPLPRPVAVADGDGAVHGQRSKCRCGTVTRRRSFRAPTTSSTSTSAPGRWRTVSRMTSSLLRFRWRIPRRDRHDQTGQNGLPPESGDAARHSRPLPRSRASATAGGPLPTSLRLPCGLHEVSQG
jgi:hypothetical protein